MHFGVFRLEESKNRKHFNGGKKSVLLACSLHSLDQKTANECMVCIPLSKKNRSCGLISGVYSMSEPHNFLTNSMLGKGMYGKRIFGEGMIHFLRVLGSENSLHKV